MARAITKTMWDEVTAREYYRNGYWDVYILNDYMDYWASIFPDKEFVVGTTGRYTLKETKEIADRLALKLLDLGVEKGDIISVQLPSWAEVVFVELAAYKIGAVYNVINPAFRAQDVGYILRESQSKILVVPGEFRGFDYAQMVEELRPQLPGLEHVITVGEGTAPGTILFKDLLLEPPRKAYTEEHVRSLKPHADDVCLLIFTSGSTGFPKGVLHTGNTVISMARACAEACGLKQLGLNETVLALAPVSHLFGLGGLVNAAILRGARIVLLDVFSPQAALELIGKEKVTRAAGVPAQFLVILDELAQHRGKYDVSSLKSFWVAAAPCPPEAIHKFVELTGAQVSCVYGLSEGSPSAEGLPGDPLDLVATTGGMPRFGQQIKIVDAEGNELPRGQAGEILTKGPVNSVGYYNNPEVTAKSYTPDGWLKTGDKGWLGEDGFVRIVGRIKDTIRRGSEDIDPVEIENLLAMHPKIADIAVVAMPDRRLGQRPCAYVVSRGDERITLEEMQAFLRDRIATFKMPERLEFVGEIPRTSSGKIQRFKLAEDIANKVASESPA